MTRVFSKANWKLSALSIGAQDMDWQRRRNDCFPQSPLPFPLKVDSTTDCGIRGWKPPLLHKMHCSKCGNLEDKVIDSRLSKDGRSIRRRRECVGCGQRFTTYEEIEREDLRVLKRDGRSEPFDRHKLLGGMRKACEKRPVTLEMLEKASHDILQSLEQDFQREIPSHLIGTKVMDSLHQLDEVAYVRYASVYRSFQDIGEFIEEIQSLGKRHKRSALQPELFK